MSKLNHLSLLAVSVLLCVVAPVAFDVASTANAQLDPTPVIQGYEASPCGLSLLWRADGDSAGDYFGFSVASEGDFDGDGDPWDIAVGALLAREEQGGVHTGSWTVFFDSLRQKWVDFGNADDDLGRALCFASLNRPDGRSRVVVGATGALDSNGIVLVDDLTMQEVFTYLGTGTGDKLGYSLDYCGDMDFDNHDDIIVGAPEAEGPLGPRTGYVVLLSPELASPVNWRIDGGQAGARFGHAVAYAGSHAGADCYCAAVGAPLASVIGTPLTAVGSAFVYRCDGALVWRYDGEKTGDYFGSALAAISDLDGDPNDDIIIGAHRADPGGLTDAGSVYVYSSGTHALLYRLNGENAGDNFGYSVEVLADLDGDGVDDLAVGAHRADPGGRVDAGAVYVYSAGTGTLMWKIEGASEGDLFGTSLELRVDRSLYNWSEIIVGAFKTDPGGRVDAGSVYLFGCSCDCAYNGDPAHDGVTDVLDVVGTVADAFRNDPNEQGTNCRYCDSDVDCSGACDVLDVVKMVNVAFRNGDKATEFCSPCQ